MSSPDPASSNFIRDIIDADLASGRHQRIVTRWPPEPNGYPHIGHAKSICLNFGLARDYGGVCHLRFDDSNPTTEEVEYVEALQRDVRWLGFDWGDKLFFASDYFEQLYAWAVHLVDHDQAYVCSLDEEQIRVFRGTVGEAGRPSPDRDRPRADSRDLLARMRAGEFPDGRYTLRAKIDMASPNMKMRDPVLYRIRHAHHYRQGDAWCIYPMYDFIHPLSDAIEGITHSICTLEFENNRELYDWMIDSCPVPARPKQIEFARLALSYTVMSKRKLLQLVKEGWVSGWDDPRMPTLSGMRRRGVRPEAIRAFCDMIGVAKNNSTVDVEKLEFCIREDLNRTAPRVMCVLEPLRVVIDSWPCVGSEGHVEELDAPYFPADIGTEGSRKLPISREILIERDDFRLEPPKGWHRLAIGAEVRLRHGYVIRCERAVADADGNVIELRCSHDPATRDAPPADGRKIKGTIHWVSAAHALVCEVRVYDRLFRVERPDLADGALSEHLSPDSLRVLESCRIEPSVAGAAVLSRYQFERQGYFAVDQRSGPDRLVFNRIVTLRDGWAKVESKAARAAPEARPRKAKAPTAAPAPTMAASPAAEPFVLAHGLSVAQAEQIAADPTLVRLFHEAVAVAKNEKAIANWLCNELSRERRGQEQALPFGGAAIGELVTLVDDGTLTPALAKELLAEIVDKGGSPRALCAARGLSQLAGEAELDPVVAAVIAEHPAEVERYRGGKANLIGFFVGQVMKRTAGRANAARVTELVRGRLG